MRLLPYILYLLLIAMHEVIWRDVTAVYGATINLPAFLVLAVALYKSELTTSWFGFIAGLMLAAGMPDRFGWHALVMAVVGLTVFHVRERVNVESLWTKCLLMFSGILLHNLLVILINQPGGFLHLLWYSALTGAVYTSVLAFMFFLVKDGQVTAEKIKSIF